MRRLGVTLRFVLEVDGDVTDDEVAQWFVRDGLVRDGIPTLSLMRGGRWSATPKTVTLLRATRFEGRVDAR